MTDVSGAPTQPRALLVAEWSQVHILRTQMHTELAAAAKPPAPRKDDDDDED